MKQSVADFTSSVEGRAESGLVLDERILFLKQMNAMKNYTSTIKKVIVALKTAFINEKIERIILNQNMNKI